MGPVRREALEAMVLLTGPMIPHLGEECWETLGHKTLLVDAKWPVADPDLVREDTVVVVVQINGKRRAEVNLPKDEGEENVRAAVMALPDVQKAIDGVAVKKLIIVKNRIVNIVV
jgi:leucyl-tRNA synthetase